MTLDLTTPEAVERANAALQKALRGEPAPPDSCEGCKHALYEGDEVSGCMSDPQPPDDEPSQGKPCRYWEQFAPPDYFADDAGRNREMLRRLMWEAEQIVWDWDDRTATSPPNRWCVCAHAPGCVEHEGHGPTEAVALVRALHAAGVVALPDAVERPQPAEDGNTEEPTR